MKYFLLVTLFLAKGLCMSQDSVKSDTQLEQTDVVVTEQSIQAKSVSLKNSFFELISGLTDLQSAEDASAAGRIMNSYELNDAVNKFHKSWEVPVWVDITFAHSTLWTKVLGNPPIYLTRPDDYQSLPSTNPNFEHQPYITLDASINNKPKVNPKGKFTAQLYANSDNGNSKKFLNAELAASTNDALNKDIQGKEFSTLAEVPIGERWGEALETYGGQIPNWLSKKPSLDCNIHATGLKKAIENKNPDEIKAALDILVKTKESTALQTTANTTIQSGGGVSYDLYHRVLNGCLTNDERVNIVKVILTLNWTSTPYENIIIDILKDVPNDELVKSAFYEKLKDASIIQDLYNGIDNGNNDDFIKQLTDIAQCYWNQNKQLIEAALADDKKYFFVLPR